MPSHRHLSPWTSDDINVALAPYVTYVQLVARDRYVSWLRALERPALYALLVGISVAIAATGRISFLLLASTTISWAWVVVVQLLLAFLMMWPSGQHGQLSRARLVELWFTGHVPWTLWMLFSAPAIRALPWLPVETILLTMLVPIAWTMVIAAAFNRAVAHRSLTQSWLRAVVQQLLVITLVLSYVAWSAGGWFRLVE